MDFLLSKYGVIFTEFDCIPPRSVLSNSVNITPYWLSKMSITVLLYSKQIYKLYICLSTKFYLKSYKNSIFFGFFSNMVWCYCSDEFKSIRDWILLVCFSWRYEATEGPRVNCVMRAALFEIYTWILCRFIPPWETNKWNSILIFIL